MDDSRSNSLFPALAWAGVLTIFFLAGCEGDVNDGALPTDDGGTVECNENEILTQVEKADGTMQEICMPIDETDGGVFECPEGQVPKDFTPENSPHVTVRCMDDCSDGQEWSDCRKLHSNIPSPCCVDICAEGETLTDVSELGDEFAEFLCSPPCPPPNALTGEVLCYELPASRLEYFIWEEDGLCYAEAINLYTGEHQTTFAVPEELLYCIPRN